MVVLITSAMDVALEKSGSMKDRPSACRCACASAMPGMTVLPFRSSIGSSANSDRVKISEAFPTARMRPVVDTTKAVTGGAPSSTVCTVPLKTM